MMIFFWDKDIEAVLQRFHRLTIEEARTTAAQTLGIIHRLVQNMQEFIDGEQMCLACHLPTIEFLV